jgi:4-amino-4-deoxy-L-arabinose transferase-like glycosyltransferase
VWLGALVTPLASDPLWANRCLSVAFGLLTLITTVAIADRLFDRRVGLVAGAFYVFCPFTLFYDRLALADACLSALFALTVLLSLRIVIEAEERLRFGILTGVVMALGVYAKAPGVLLFAVPMATAMFLGFRRGAWRALLAAYAVGVPPAAYALWRFATTRNSADMFGIATRNEQPFLVRSASNLGVAAGWLWELWTPTLAVLGLAGLAIALLRGRRPGLLLAALAAFPAVAFGMTVSRWLPRYLLFGSAPFLVLGAWALCVLVDRATTARPGAFRSAALAVASAAVLVPSLCFDLALWTDPPRAPLPALEREQFVVGWTSGYGIRDTERLVREELARHPEGVTVVVHANRFRTLRATPLALGLAFAREPRVRFEDWDLAHPSAVPALERWAAAGPALLVVPRADPLVPPPDMAPFAPLLTPVATTRKPDGRPCDDVYRLGPAAHVSGTAP